MRHAGAGRAPVITSRPDQQSFFVPESALRDTFHEPSEIFATALPSLAPGQDSPILWCALRTLHRSGICEVKMFQDFCSTPLPFRTRSELLDCHSARSRGNCLLQTVQIRIHDASHSRMTPTFPVAEFSYHQEGGHEEVAA